MWHPRITPSCIRDNSGRSVAATRITHLIGLGSEQCCRNGLLTTLLLNFKFSQQPMNSGWSIFDTLHWVWTLVVPRYSSHRCVHSVSREGIVETITCQTVQCIHRKAPRFSTGPEIEAASSKVIVRSNVFIFTSFFGAIIGFAPMTWTYAVKAAAIRPWGQSILALWT